MSDYPSTDILDYLVSALGAISESRGDSFTPIWVAKRRREGGEEHQELPSITCYLTGSDGDLRGAPVDEIVIAGAEAVLDPEGNDLDPEGAANLAREDMLAALMRSGGVTTSLNIAELVGWESEFLWDIEGRERDIGCVILYRFAVTRARDAFRIPNI